MFVLDLFYKNGITWDQGLVFRSWTLYVQGLDSILGYVQPLSADQCGPGCSRAPGPDHSLIGWLPRNVDSDLWVH